MIPRSQPARSCQNGSSLSKIREDENFCIQSIQEFAAESHYPWNEVEVYEDLEPRSLKKVLGM